MENSPTGSIIMLVVGVAIAILVILFMGVLSGAVFQQSESTIEGIGQHESVVNESFVVSNTTNVSLAHPFILSDPVITNLSTVIYNGNFTYNLASGTIISLGKYNGTTFNATYTYRNTTIQDKIMSSIISSFQAQEKTTTYVPIIILAVIIAIVLGLVLGMTVFSKKEGGGQAL